MRLTTAFWGLNRPGGLGKIYRIVGRDQQGGHILCIDRKGCDSDTKWRVSIDRGKWVVGSDRRANDFHNFLRLRSRCIGEENDDAIVIEERDDVAPSE